MANILILNQNQIWNGLGTLTYTVPAGTASGTPYNVKVQSTFPSAVPINDSYSDNLPGSGANHPPGNTAIGAGSSAGLGAGTGGGREGFTGGDLGLGNGGVGQGFGAGNGYQQPPSAGSNVVANNPVTSSVSIVVNKNGVAQYTSTVPAVFQSAVQFRTSFLANASDTITVVLSSAASSDNQLSGVTSNISVGQGL